MRLVNRSYNVVLALTTHSFSTFLYQHTDVRMPFKLRLKKSKQYNVVTKTVFVICVELLDNSIVECTLSADSLGYDCLDNVCQRLGLNQVYNLPCLVGLVIFHIFLAARVFWPTLCQPKILPQSTLG